MNRIVETLSRPDAYPHAAGDLEVHHTHISVVFLAGDFAYKVKKPLILPFLDYGTLERRRQFCQEEVRLNHRLAPEVYLGVVPVVDRRGRLRVEVDADLRGGGERVGGPPHGEIVEWAVRMRRLPHDRTLHALLETDRIGASDVARVAEHLAAFHRTARRAEEIAWYGRFEVVAENARDNLRQSTGQVGATVDEAVFQRLSAELERALATARPTIEDRARRGVPCDNHGDLRLDHVYFLRERQAPTIVDCIEFNPAFRFADPVADMAFLAMDLMQAGRWDLSRAFSDAWFAATGDGDGRELLDFYVAYRACVRGKVQGIKAAEEEIPPEDREEAARTARGHWLLALGALAPPAERPGLVLVGGLPGTGKTTVARALAGVAGFAFIRSDVVRKELAGLDPDARAGASWGAGLYGSRWSDRTYEVSRRRAEEILLRGGRVVVDASFHAEARRRTFLDTAIALGVRMAFLVCETPMEVARARLASRRGDASDAGEEVYEEMARAWEMSVSEVARITAAVPTDAPPADVLERALAALRERGLW